MISIALATYNGSAFIKDQIESIFSQTWNDFEIIACDDCSTDNTLKILREYALKDYRLKVYQNKTNLGFKKNFEHILSLCSGEYIACCDQDDIWEKDHLEILFNNIGTNDCIGANATIIDKYGNFMNLTTKDMLSVDSSLITPNSIFRHECFYNIIQGTACLFRKELLTKILPFPDGIQFHDHWIALNASVQNGCMYIPDIVLQYRNHEKNITGYKKFNIFHALKTIFQARSIRKQIYSANLAMLMAIKQNNLPVENIFHIDNAINFFKNLSNGKKRFSIISYYIKNYNDITLCPKKKWKLFLYRLFCLIVFGLML